MLNELAHIYHENLLKTNRALSYLYKRGINIETIKRFTIGYCNNNIGLKWAQENYTSAQIKHSKMFKFGHDFFNGKIIFPLWDNNQVKYFTSRGIDNPIHLHMIGPITLPYNFNSIDKESLIITESPIDCLTLEQNRFNAIATLGVFGLRKSILQKIKASEVYIAYDRDPNQTGQKAAYRIAELLMESHIIAKIIQWPQSYNKIDVNSFFCENPNDFQYNFENLLLSAIPYTKTKAFTQTKKSNFKNNGSWYSLIKKYDLPLRNGQVKMKCPFHPDNKPSLSINISKNFAKCFGCGKRPTIEEMDKALRKRI